LKIITEIGDVSFRLSLDCRQHGDVIVGTWAVLIRIKTLALFGGVMLSSALSGSAFGVEACGAFRPHTAPERTGSKTCIVGYNLTDGQVFTVKNRLIPTAGKGCPRTIHGFNGYDYTTFSTTFSCEPGKLCFVVGGAKQCCSTEMDKNGNGPCDF
jgi:hypothetical protein